MSVVAVIPARYASTRFPAKALAAQTGKFMVQHVYERVREAARIDKVIIATDDERIVTAVRSFDGQVQMTRADHVSGTDRVGEVAEALGLGDEDVVLNVQGDEPEINPDSLNRLVARMVDPPPSSLCTKGSRNHVGCENNSAHPNRDSQASSSAYSISPHPGPLPRGEGERRDAMPVIGTIAAPFDDAGPREGSGSPLDPNCVKVVLDSRGNALYFSRSPIPYPRSTGGRVDRPSRWLLHMGVYAFRASALRAISGGRMPVSEIERTESLEQLRWLDNGYKIAVVVVDDRSVGIDTPEDYAAFVARWRARNKLSAPVR
jgi:3-deoxy-manno-octulosonate cytidylyltransferase (CMP-KDO synthetase)